MYRGQKTSKILIVGLGNLDRVDTRHSVGMQVVDWLASRLNADWSSNKQLKAMIARKVIHAASATEQTQVDCHLLKSKIPMNGNGVSVIKAAHLYSIDQKNIFLICDELDKATGKFSIKESGSARGHNGIRSVFSSLSTDNVPRLLMGIDRPTSKAAVVGYVLDNFTAAERLRVQGVMGEACTALLRLIEHRLQLNPQELVRHFISVDGSQATQQQNRASNIRVSNHMTAATAQPVVSPTQSDMPRPTLSANEQPAASHTISANEQPAASHLQSANEQPAASCTQSDMSMHVTRDRLGHHNKAATSSAAANLCKSASNESTQGAISSDYEDRQDNDDKDAQLESPLKLERISNSDDNTGRGL